jgi:hypothetical protein
MDVPEDLRLLAANEQEFKEHNFKAQHGIAQDNQSTMLLKEALAAGQKGKAGIGFKATGGKRPKANQIEDSGDLMDQYRDVVASLKQKEFQIKAAEMLGFDDGV